MYLSGYFHLWSMIVMGSELLRMCPIYTVNTGSTFSYALPCVAVSQSPLCCEWVFNQNIHHLLTFKSYLNHRLLTRALQVFSSFCFMEHICPLYLQNDLKSHEFCLFVFFTGFVFTSLRTVPFTLCYIIYYITDFVWDINAAFLQLLRLFVVEADVYRRVHTRDAADIDSDGTIPVWGGKSWC